MDVSDLRVESIQLRILKQRFFREAAVSSLVKLRLDELVEQEQLERRSELAGGRSAENGDPGGWARRPFRQEEIPQGLPLSEYDPRIDRVQGAEKICRKPASGGGTGQSTILKWPPSLATPRPRLHALACSPDLSNDHGAVKAPGSGTGHWRRQRLLSSTWATKMALFSS